MVVNFVILVVDCCVQFHIIKNKTKNFVRFCLFTYECVREKRAQMMREGVPFS